MMRSWRPSLRCRHESLHLFGQRRSLVIRVKDGYQTNIAKLVNDDKAAEQFVHETLEVKGYVQSVRKQSKIAFAAIRDGSSMKTLQVVLDPEQARSLTVGGAVSLTGSFEECLSTRAKQPYELQVAKVTSLGQNEPEDAPIQNKYQTPHYLRTIPHMRARMSSHAALLRWRSIAIRQCHDYFFEQGFVNTHTPLITASDCEGAGEVFTLESNAASKSNDTDHDEHFFKTPKYLTVSAQLHLEALAQSVGKVWTLSPTFRAEKSDTPRHLSEFYMLEAEMTFTTGLNDVMNVVEDCIKHIANGLNRNPDVRNDLLNRLKPAFRSTLHTIEPEMDEQTMQRRWAGVKTGRRWPRVQYDEAFLALELNGFKDDPLLNYENGFTSDQERWLAEHIGQGSPVFVTDYPKKQKPFYMLPTPGNEEKTVSCFDLLVPDLCEIAGGSLREHRLEPLEMAMKEKGLYKDAGGEIETLIDEDDTKEARKEKNALDWYLDLRRYGSVPHGGFGIGFDRLLCYLAGVSNVRDMVTFPRWAGRCDT